MSSSVVAGWEWMICDRNMPHPHKRIRGTTPEIEQAARHLRHRLTPATLAFSYLSKLEQSDIEFT